MEGPGGYQFVGRTIQMWNRWNQTADFKEGKPWLLRFFDQIRFYPVTEQELLQMRADFPHGKFQLKVEETTFSLKEYNAFLQAESASINAFKTVQQASFDAERERWIATGQANYNSEAEVANDQADALVLADGSRAIASHVAGNLWQVQVQEGDEVQEGDVLVIVESMKMEISVTAPCAGKVSKVLCNAGSAVAAGQNLVVIAET
jgi:urea carboxylase